MKQRLIGWAVTAVVLVGGAAPALARPQEQEREIVDARLEGYAKNVTLEGGGTSLTWILFIFLGAVCVAGLFKDAKRTHLD